jgi:mono/diheme cytochrome c family protein
LLAVSTSTVADSAEIDFIRDVQPVFQRHCYPCHGPEKHKSEFRLDVRDVAFKGGELYAPNIKPSQAAESTLIQFVSGNGDLEMPPEGPRLSPEEITTLRTWVDQGAPWPDEVAGAVVDKNDWWAWKPLSAPAVPSVDEISQTARIANPIDNFIVAKLHDNGLRQSPPADGRTLIRRVYFDLTGLPPTPEEVEAFAADDDPKAYARVVDRLLASPRYGERWARHWMDAAHFAETHGHDQDRIREHAWPFRDYLIASLNADKPYGRFIQEQIAGDALFPEDPQATIALGFLAAGPWDESSLRDIQEDTVDRQVARYLDRDDMIATVMNNVVSVTVQCARCHDHKFDPISQSDYYALQAVFSGVERANRPIPAASNGQPTLVYAAASKFEPDGGHKPPPGPRPIHILHRGDIGQPRELAAAGALSCIAELSPRFDVPESADESLRRVALARWLTDPRNPLTWRSIVNRVWHHHFGAGLETTLNDFGHMGGAPSHPELLDWLAVNFRDGDQSLKQLHRLIVTCETYRQTSRTAVLDPADAAQAAAIDADNRLLRRMNRTRLDSEAIHDAVLAAAGRLDLRMGGPSDRQFALSPGIHVTPNVDYKTFDLDSAPARRRSVYRFLFRTLPDPLMDALDCPSGDQITPSRINSVTVQQALALWNSAFILRNAEHFAERLNRGATGLEKQITLAVQLTLNRPPSDAERLRFSQYAKIHGLANFCRLLFNANEFVFID